jgi:hypothetical protein
MWRAELRRIRDRKFIPFDWNKHWVRAYSLVKCKASWDLFPPVSGYRAFSKAKGSYNVSSQRQHGDWSKKVLSIEPRCCANCSKQGNLEAHHLWPQSWFPNLRYVLRNGVPLCSACHQHAPRKHEITPNQFRWLTEKVRFINDNIEHPNFWEYYTSSIEKGRVIVAGITQIEFDLTSPKIQRQLEYFKELDSYNDFCGMFIKSASEPPHIDAKFRINRSLWSSPIARKGQS